MTTALILDSVDAEAVVQQWVAKAARDDQSQRRRESRFPFLNPARICSTGEEAGVLCRDISKSGIGVIQYGVPPRPGPATLSLLLHQQLAYLDVDFRWVKPMGNGWWTSGGKLNSVSIDHAARLVLRMTNLLERRFHRRYPFSRPFIVYPNLQPGLESVGLETIPRSEEKWGISLDVSSGGLRLICREPLHSESEYVYLRTPRWGYSDTMVRGRIASRRELGNGYFAIGIQFKS